MFGPIVVTVQKDQTAKLALDSKKIIKYLHKNKYQMPKKDSLLDNLAHVVKSDKSKQTLFSTLDFWYAYSQIPVDNSTREQCNFSPFDGNAIGTYQFETGFNAFTDLPAEFQKAIDQTLIKCTETYDYVDDKLMVTKDPIVSEPKNRGY